jgi:hypothetical protein
MCHCKTCADRLHVITVIIAIAVPYSLASRLIRFWFVHTSIPFTSPRIYALPIVHDISSKNAKLSSATTSFPWRHTNTSKNHGYNAVADDPCRTRNSRLLQRHFRDVTLTSARITDITLSRVTCAGSHYVPRIRHLPQDEKGQKGRIGQTFSDHTYSRSLPDQGGDVCKVWFSNVNLYKVQTNKLSALCIRYGHHRRQQLFARNGFNCSVLIVKTRMCIMKQKMNPRIQFVWMLSLKGLNVRILYDTKIVFILVGRGEEVHKCE